MSFQQSFKALADPTRRQVLELLREGPLTAGEIGAPMTMPTAATVTLDTDLEGTVHVYL